MKCPYSEISEQKHAPPPTRKQEQIRYTGRASKSHFGSRVTMRRPAVISPDEHAAISASKEAAAHGKFASDEQVRATWTKYSL